MQFLFWLLYHFDANFRNMDSWDDRVWGESIERFARYAKPLIPLIRRSISRSHPRRRQAAARVAGILLDHSLKPGLFVLLDHAYSYNCLSAYEALRNYRAHGLLSENELEYLALFESCLSTVRKKRVIVLKALIAEKATERVVGFGFVVSNDYTGDVFYNLGLHSKKGGVDATIVPDPAEFPPDKVSLLWGDGRWIRDVKEPLEGPCLAWALHDFAFGPALADGEFLFLYNHEEGAFKVEKGVAVRVTNGKVYKASCMPDFIVTFDAIGRHSVIGFLSVKSADGDTLYGDVFLFSDASVVSLDVSEGDTLYSRKYTTSVDGSECRIVEDEIGCICRQKR